LAYGPRSSRSGRSRQRTPRKRTSALLPRAERLEDRSCPSSYSLTVLSPLPGDAWSQAFGINDAGQAVGYSAPIDDTQPGHAVLWQAGASTPIDLGSLFGGDSRALGINSVGEIVGWSVTSAGLPHAFLWQNGAMTDLGTLGGSLSEAEGINASGQVVGESSTASGAKDAFLWTPTTPNGTTGTMTDLGTLGGTGAVAYSINITIQTPHTTQIVGQSTTASGDNHAFLWQNGAMTDLGAPPNSTGGLAYGINGKGQVAAISASNNSWPDPRAFLWQNGRWTDLGTLKGVPRAGSRYYAYALNDSAQVVGQSIFYADSYAFVWQSKGGMQDLNTLIPGGTGVTLYAARGINNNGQIAGWAYSSRIARGFLLTPTTAPNSNLTAASPRSAATAVGSSGTPLGTATAGSGDSGSLPQGPLGVIPDTSSWATTLRLAARRRHSTDVPDLLSMMTFDPAGR
jgi:probable HAF family extracellular repeat protein